MLALTNPPLREVVVVAEVLDVLKGRYSEQELRFVRHGHGIVAYEKGDEVLLFVERIGKSSELGRGRLAEHVGWVSRQETGAKFALDETTRGDLTAAVRAYAALDELPAATRPDAMRRLTMKMLASPHAALSASALRDVVLSGDAPIVSAADLPELEALIDGPETRVGIRIGLLAELERRGLVVGPPRWAALLRSTSGAERIAVVRAAGAHPSGAVTKELVKLLSVNDPQLVSTAAVSLGSPGNDSALAPLAGLLAREDPRVRMAAIRALGRVGTPAAKQALAEAAASHPDPATRRRAAAEVKLLAGRGAPERRVGSAQGAAAP